MGMECVMLKIIRLVIRKSKYELDASMIWSFSLVMIIYTHS